MAVSIMSTRSNHSPKIVAESALIARTRTVDCHMDSCLRLRDREPRSVLPMIGDEDERAVHLTRHWIMPAGFGPFVRLQWEQRERGSPHCRFHRIESR